MARIQSCQVDSRLRHQRDESGDEIHRLEDDVRGAIAVLSIRSINAVFSNSTKYSEGIKQPSTDASRG